MCVYIYAHKMLKMIDVLLWNHRTLGMSHLQMDQRDFSVQFDLCTSIELGSYWIELKHVSL